MWDFVEHLFETVNLFCPNDMLKFLIRENIAGCYNFNRL